MITCLGLVGALQGHQFGALNSISAMPTFLLVADHDLGRLILLSGDTSGTDLEFTASRITKH